MNEIPGITGNEQEGKTTQSEFIAKFKTIFDKRNTTSIKKTKLNQIPQSKDYETGEQVYSLSLSYGEKYLGWSFTFALRSGKYKLIRIDVAG